MYTFSEVVIWSWPIFGDLAAMTNFHGIPSLHMMIFYHTGVNCKYLLRDEYISWKHIFWLSFSFVMSYMGEKQLEPGYMPKYDLLMEMEDPMNPLLDLRMTFYP